MKWLKKGKIFSPVNNIPSHCMGFAQGPQAIELDDRIRVYFSTRELDIHNKYLSHVSYVDFDKTFSSVLNVNKEKILSLGTSGTFDEHGIFPFHPYKINNKIYGYTTGWNRKMSVSADASIGLVVSQDNGGSFERLGDGPILGASLHEPFLIGDPFVLQHKKVFHMWYIYGVKWLTKPDTLENERVYKITHATSADGVNWKRDSSPIIDDKMLEDECQAMPTIFQHNGQFHMYFCYRSAFDFRRNRDCGYKIGYAYSYNLVDWVRDDRLSGIELSIQGWDSEMMCYPNIITVNHRVYMLYNGNEFGKHGFGVAELIG
ncbi:hypothetical protein GCM10008107_08870 [Psychrosphaera saromensis]|uniref:Glycosylase n=1 Tax=Psychrosphaera saromensis TaxID=716813 RepID=A0A2S7UVM6_9GAMM|nr:hypothetical protein [Psychrosphaera saromensis]PQJ53819.1 hypothetical protein BTO11_09175 [Psychrosphaera saromensis]GHB62116.1 hypothetical protein GCM10008107_08870 [Psychrosphaera saromensis]GLQ15390.1 hypothetical protein GCM10007917_28450 [Psychrosphaera saromensis]